MLQCPACDATLDQDFGMVTCQNCGAVLIVEMSGDVQMSTDSETDSPEEFDEFVTENTHHHNTDEKPGQIPETTVQKNHDEYDQPDDIEQYIENPSSTENLSESPDEFDKQDHFKDRDDDTKHDPNLKADPFESQSTGEKENFDNPGEVKTTIVRVENFTQDLSPEKIIHSTPEESGGFTEVREQESYQAPEVEESLNSDPESTKDSPTSSRINSRPVDITEFANSEQSNMDEGEYLYDLTIDRLDSKDLREALKRVLTDKKLKINDHEVLRKIKNGKVCIPNLNPVKAKRIVEQLQFYDLHIHWKQKRIVMEESLSEEEQEAFNEQTDDE